MSSPATPPLVQQQGRTTSSSSSSSGVCARVKMYSGRPFRRMEMGSTLAAKSAPAVQMQPQLWINFSLNDTEGSPLEKLCSGESQHDGTDVDPTASPVNGPDREEGLLDSTKKPEKHAGQRTGCKGDQSSKECLINSPERSEVTEDVLHVYSASSRRRKGVKHSGSEIVNGMPAKPQEHVQVAPAMDTLETCTNILLRLRNHKFGASFSRARSLHHQAEAMSAAGDAPLDLSVVHKRLTTGCYAHPVLFADDVRAVFKAVLAHSSNSTSNDLREQALTLLRLFEEDVAQHGIAAPELVSGRSKASPQTFQPHQQQQQQGEDAPAVQMESVEQAGTAALPLPPCTARVDAEAPVAEAAEKGRHGSSSPGGSPRLSSSGCGGDVSRSAWSTEVSGVTSWSPVWGGEQEQEEDEELRRGELDTMEGILQLSAGPEGGALASLKGVGGEVVACLEVYSEGKGHVKRPRSKGKSQKKRSFGAVSKSEEAEDGTSSEAEEASLPLSTLLAHRTAPRPEAKAAGAPAAVKAEPGVEMRKKPKKQAAPSHPAGVAAPLGTTAAADVPPGVVALEGSPQELAALEVLSGLLCSSEAPDEGSAHRGGARAAGMKTTTLAARAAAASCLKACSATGFNGPSGVPAVNFGDGAAASVLASLASLSREGSLTQESADSVLDVLEKKPLVQSLSSHPSLVHKVLRKPCPALPGLLLVSECGVACHGPSSARSTSSSVSARGKGAAGKRARGGGFLAPPGLGSSSCSCAQGGMDGLCSLSPARTPSVVTSGWVAAAGPPRRVRSTTPADHPILAGHGAKGPHSPGLRSARTHLCAESISSSRRSMPAVPGCTAPVPRPMEPLDSPDHNHGLHPREVSPELCSGALGVVCQGLARGLPSSASSGDDWGLMTQADLHTLLARGLGRKQDGVHAPSSGADLPGNSTTPVGDSDGPVGLDAWQSQSVDLGAGLTPQPSAGAVSLQQLAAGEEVQDGQCAARTRGYWWDRATRPRRAASVASEGAAAAAAAGSRFPDAVLCSKSKGFVTSPGLARVSLGALASGSPLPNAGILPEALSAAAASPGMWEPPPFQLAEGSTQKDLAPVGVPKAGFGEIPKETGCARTNKPFCWAAHMLKNKKRMSAAGPFSGFYGAPMGVPVDCEAEAAAAAAAVLGLRGSSVEDSFGCISAPAGSSGFASAQLKGGAPPASSLLHSIPPLLPLSNAQSASHAQLSRVLAPQSSSAGSADVPATPLLSGVRIPSEGQRLGGKLQASGTPHLWASWGDGAPTKVVGSRKPPISTFGAGHPGAPAVAAGLASDGGLKTSAPCNVSTGSLTTIV